MKCAILVQESSVCMVGLRELIETNLTSLSFTCPPSKPGVICLGKFSGTNHREISRFNGDGL